MAIGRRARRLPLAQIPLCSDPVINKLPSGALAGRTQAPQPAEPG